MAKNFFEIELLYCGVAVLDDPVVGAPTGVFGSTGAVAVAAGIERQGGLEGWKGIYRARREWRCRWCAMDDMKEDE